MLTYLATTSLSASEALREKDGKWTPTLLATDVGVPVEFTPDPRNGDILFADIGPLNNQANGKIKRLVRAGLQGPLPPGVALPSRCVWAI